MGDYPERDKQRMDAINSTSERKPAIVGNLCAKQVQKPA